MEITTYTTQQAATIFGVARETVRSWAVEFEKHLSHKANPGENLKRIFTFEDLEVLALIAEMKQQNILFTDIHAALDNGQRGTIPESTLLKLQTTSDTTALTVRIEQLEKSLTTAQEKLQELDRENIRLTTKLEDAVAERERLEKQVIDLQEKIEQLSQASGEQYAKGFTTGFDKGREAK